MKTGCLNLRLIRFEIKRFCRDEKLWFLLAALVLFAVFATLAGFFSTGRDISAYTIGNYSEILDRAVQLYSAECEQDYQKLVIACYTGREDMCFGNSGLEYLLDSRALFFTGLVYAALLGVIDNLGTSKKECAKWEQTMKTSYRKIQGCRLLARDICVIFYFAVAYLVEIILYAVLTGGLILQPVYQIPTYYYSWCSWSVAVCIFIIFGYMCMECMFFGKILGLLSAYRTVGGTVVGLCAIGILLVTGHFIPTVYYRAWPFTYEIASAYFKDFAPMEVGGKLTFPIFTSLIFLLLLNMFILIITTAGKKK